MITNPVITPRAPIRSEASGMRSKRDADMVGRSWRKNDETQRQTNASLQAQRISELQNKRLFRWRAPPPPPMGFHPFKVSQSPSRTDIVDTSNWRTFRVRAGAFGTADVGGTDGANENPFNPLTPLVDPDTSMEDTTWIDYHADVDFVVPDATAAYYVWVDASDPDAPVIGKGTTIPGGGTDADWWGGTYFLIAKIDTNTYTAESRSIVRQYICYDIPKCA